MFTREPPPFETLRPLGVITGGFGVGELFGGEEGGGAVRDAAAGEVEDDGEAAADN